MKTGKRTKPFVNDALNLLNLIGLNPCKMNKLRMVITATIVANVLMEVILDIVLKWKGVASFEAISDFVVMWQIIFKCLLLVFKKIEFIKFLDILQEFWSIDKFGTKLRHDIEKSYKRIASFIKIMKITYCFLVFSYILKPILTKTRTFLVPSHIPSVDLLASPVFQLNYALETIAGVFGITAMMGFDILFLCFIAHAVCELRLIKERFARISFSEPAYCKEIYVLVEHHTKILFGIRFIGDLSDCYSPLMLNQFITSILCQCGGLLILSGDGTVSSTAEIIKTIIYLVTLLGYMFFYCAAGSKIIEESEDVARAIYESKWWTKTKPKFRRYLALCMQRSQRSAKLKSAGMFVLDLKCFSGMLRIGFSFFTLIRTVYSKL